MGVSEKGNLFASLLKSQLEIRLFRSQNNCLVITVKYVLCVQKLLSFSSGDKMLWLSSERFHLPLSAAKFT